jgi:glutathione synthase/RimK-type ligase-like ATP-grasp enzyme
VRFKDVLVGPGKPTRLTIDLANDRLIIDGRPIRPTACFMRHDVFLAQAGGAGGGGAQEANAAALNWYAAIKGWELAHDDVRGFNKNSIGADSNKLANLYAARRSGLTVPPTILTNDFSGLRQGRGSPPLIQKPAAGGDHTGLLADLVTALPGRGPVALYPRFVQPRLNRPELRVYRIGNVLLGYSLTSPDLDYRMHQRVKLKPARVPKSVARPLVALCDGLELDFAAADFMRDPKSGEFVFLEVNSQPMFAAFDKVSGGKLCDAIIDHLSAPER